MGFCDHRLLIFDGACGTNLQMMNLPESVWDGHQGCNEYLNLSAPDQIVQLHRSFVEAGAMVLETNTFGASRIVLSEYGLENKVEAINTAAVENARKAIGDNKNVYIAGSVGPGTKLASLGHLSVEALTEALRQQIQVLVQAGVDAIILETCQDLLQAKTAVITCVEILEQLGRDIPILLSVTMEQQGTMLLGTDIAAVVATMEPFPLFSLGLNCATGPADMESHIRYLSHSWHGRISCIPNQGLPEIIEGRTVYPLKPKAFAEIMRQFIETLGVSIVGGCCGTTAEHIRCLSDAVASLMPAARDVVVKPSVSSLYQAIEIRQDIPPLLIGERCNTNGSKEFRQMLLAEDFDGCLKVALDQEVQGAQVLDVCTAYAGRDEKADLIRLFKMLIPAVKVPLMIDSTQADCVAAILKLYPGRCIINSINLEDGGANLHRICTLAKKYGAAVIALTINKKGMAMTADEKVETAAQIYHLAVNEHGLRPGDVLFDPLTFTIGSGDETLKDAAIQTLTAIRRIKKELPGVHTLLGVSNISFGLRPAARKILNSVFLHEAVEAGLDAAIIDIAKVIPLAQISQQDRQVCLDLIYNRQSATDKTPLLAFIDYFEAQGDPKQQVQETRETASEKVMHQMIVKGNKDGLEDVLTILLQRYGPLEIINTILVPAMRYVGELFGRGEILLPFVLQSAEVMKRSVAFLEPYMDKTDQPAKLKILLATVQGDVHDIGKNLVDIILTNNGYRVYNLGINVPAETIIEKAREYAVDLVGLSGLLVKSAIVMQESMAQYRQAKLNVPILLGGAALTQKFVAESCVPQYDHPVVYCRDAFAGLKAVRDFEQGKLTSTVYESSTPRAASVPAPKLIEIDKTNPVPSAPFLGQRYVTDIDPARIYPYVNEQALFRGRWGYRRGKMSAQEYQTLIQETVIPIYEKLKQRGIDEQLIQPQVTYGYFECYSRGNSLLVEDCGRQYEFCFPRQEFAPHLCIADFYKSKDQGGDITGFFVVTVGPRIGQMAKELFEKDAYHDYLMLHGFGVEVTDALAEYWHEVMRQELGIAQQRPKDTAGFATQQYQGSRYGFGYPSCPDLGAHELVFKLLRPEAIGVTLTENMEMVPEQTTSAIIAHHPQAKYFAV